MSQASEANNNNSNNSNKNSNSNNKTKIIIAISAAVVVIAVCITVIILSRDKESDSTGIAYASEAVVVLDQDSLQAAVNAAQANARNNMVALSYQNNAYSTDGKTFSCFIANSGENIFDMFLAIYADADMTDQVYLSGLVRPGSGFEEITLDRELEPGDHTMYVAVTQVVTEEDGTQVIKNQVVHTIDFHVT